jgi:hypothetical protein
VSYHALCFLGTPFGQKPDLKSGVVVDFRSNLQQGDQTGD